LGDHQTTKLRLEPNGERSEFWSLDRSYGWYDLTITSSLDSSFEHRLAGHLETGRDSMSDPAIGTVHHQREKANLDQVTMSPVED
jgi:phospholipase C